MKAWLVRKHDERHATIVFAETRGKAKYIAMSTEACEDADYIDIECNRAQNMDKHYTSGKTEMDWFDPEDRIALVKDAGFSCDYADEDIDECSSCPAKDWCDMYQGRLDELGGAGNEM